MKINLDCLQRDPDCSSGRLPDYETLDLLSGGSHIYGEVYLPGGIYEAPHPCAVLCHGFPGVACQDDLAQALRRIGFAVIRLNHRGAWGSEGFYTFTGCIADAICACEHARDEGSRRYGIDPENIFLVGHSMGGNTALNAARRLPWIRGTVLIAPYDLDAAFRYDAQPQLAGMIHEEGRLLHLESEQALLADARQCHEETAFPAAAVDFRSRALLMIGGTMDRIAPVEWMIDPLYDLLPHDCEEAGHQRVLLPSTHGFCSCRLALIEQTASWLTRQMAPAR